MCDIGMHKTVRRHLESSRSRHGYLLAIEHTLSSLELLSICSLRYQHASLNRSAPLALDVFVGARGSPVEGKRAREAHVEPNGRAVMDDNDMDDIGRNLTVAAGLESTSCTRSSQTELHPHPVRHEQRLDR
ncbi:hypothetical protein DACRYDRAFT_25217 [Dacryopinax primogenitus]|uniref:Uncharacterized protein n=1 Tax=Dacryopinax primogenitus (strain DJM 731) TaxID=1858805 RepID=M5FNA1_DACPD|nr:uncharacterized protein DACRYDRAFT_25217 [Dacryopinax primogenitus]EJT97085.1 hypothetical protein DACRYDRAFT_25217 [Dacryopinax primogenitus]